MKEIHLRVLAAALDCYDSADCPVTPAGIEPQVDVELATVRSCFEQLAANHLLQSVPGEGYRPTITARELRELDPESDSPLILDADPEDCADSDS